MSKKTILQSLPSQAKQQQNVEPVTNGSRKTCIYQIRISEEMAYQQVNSAGRSSQIIGRPWRLNKDLGVIYSQYFWHGYIFTICIIAILEKKSIYFALSASSAFVIGYAVIFLFMYRTRAHLILADYEYSDLGQFQCIPCYVVENIRRLVL